MENSNRRNFLKSGTLLGGAALAASLFGFDIAPEPVPTAATAGKERVLDKGKHSLKVASESGTLAPLPNRLTKK